MATLQALRIKAKKAGIPAGQIRKASNADELSELIEGFNGTPSKPAVRKAVKKAVAKSKPATKTAAKKAPAAKSTTGKAKRPSPKPKSNGDVGRALIEDVDFNVEGDWHPRSGSAPDRIIKALKKSKGNRTKAFELLKPEIWDFMGKIKRNGEKRTKAEAEAMLKYRIARTLWDFCLKTNQHQKATNRIVYGTGPHASAATRKRLARKPAKAAQAAPKRRGRPPGTKNKPKATAKRGRPAKK